MIEVTGEYGTAKVFTDNIDETSMNQIKEMLDSPVAQDSNMCIMPDVHAGAGCVIGTTMKITDKIIPYFVGVDIGCGIAVQHIDAKDVNLTKIDNIIHERIPAGFEIRDIPHDLAKYTDINKLKCKEFLSNFHKFDCAIGTLGGGNHFIEISMDEDSEEFYLIIHSGSRNLGKQVADFYQNLAAQLSSLSLSVEKAALIERLKEEGRHKEIASELKKLSENVPKKNMEYLQDQVMDDYIHDMKIVQEYASFNRHVIAAEIMNAAGWNIDYENMFETVHNYIDTDTMILRKGAVSAQAGERLIIPMNMAWGSVIATGKGNKDWNYSCAHGAGRIMSRREAQRNLSMDDYKNTMKGIYSTCVTPSTLDESPQAYKDPEEVLNNLTDTIRIEKRLIPIYNFKANE